MSRCESTGTYTAVKNKNHCVQTTGYTQRHLHVVYKKHSSSFFVDDMPTLVLSRSGHAGMISALSSTLCHHFLDFLTRSEKFLQEKVFAVSAT